MIECIFNTTILFSAFLLYLIYRWGVRRQTLHLKLGRKGPWPLPFLGNLWPIARNGVHSFDRSCREKFGNLYPTYFANFGMTMVSDEELLKQILIKDFKCFSDRLDLGLQTKATEKFLTALKGKDWERVRNIISPTFTSGKLKKMSPLLSACVDLLLKRLHNTPHDEPIDVKEFFGALTMDTIARSMFGMEINSQTNPNNPFIINAKKLFNISFRNPLMWIIIICPALGRILLKWFPDWEFLGQNAIAFFTKNLEKAINERKQSKETFNDFLALMLKVDKEEEGEGVENQENADTRYLTTREIVAQAMVFLIAGYETTATTLSFSAYFLAMNPDVQQQLYDELLDVVGSENEISYDALMKMPLLDAAISETLRICPPAMRLDRTCTKDVDLKTSDNQIIHAKIGDVFTVPISAIHTDPLIWPDPHKFDIRRFEQEAKKDRSQYSYMPFGMGPRNCVGMRFALLETKWALASILKEFEFQSCSQTTEKLTFKKFGLTQPIKPIILKINKRH